MFHLFHMFHKLRRSWLPCNAEVNVWKVMREPDDDANAAGRGIDQLHICSPVPQESACGRWISYMRKSRIVLLGESCLHIVRTFSSVTPQLVRKVHRRSAHEPRSTPLCSRPLPPCPRDVFPAVPFSPPSLRGQASMYTPVVTCVFHYIYIYTYM